MEAIGEYHNRPMPRKEMASPDTYFGRLWMYLSCSLSRRDANQFFLWWTLAFHIKSEEDNDYASKGCRAVLSATLSLTGVG